jgi:Adenylate kinase and related kinases
MSRYFIVGNCGSGKTWLAQKMATHLSYPLYHLDEFH